jgi:hypothetical protein
MEYQQRRPSNGKRYYLQYSSGTAATSEEELLQDVKYRKNKIASVLKKSASMRRELS